MNDIETSVRESMGYQGDLRPLPSEPLIRRGRRRRFVRRAGTVGALSALAVGIAAVAATWPQPSTQPVVADPATSPTGGLQEELKKELVPADPAQEQAVQDNRVTHAEYRAGFERYRACLSDGGYQMVSVVDTGPLFDFGVPSEAVESGVDDSCYALHFKVVDMAWQLYRGAEIAQ